MLPEERLMLGMLMEVLGRKHGGDYRHTDFKLYGHQCVDDGRRHEFMPIDAAIHDETAGDHGAIAACLGQQLGMERNLERTRDFVKVDLFPWDSPTGHFRQEGIPSLIDDLAMPTGLDEGEPRPPLGSDVYIFNCRRLV